MEKNNFLKMSLFFFFHLKTLDKLFVLPLLRIEFAI